MFFICKLMFLTSMNYYFVNSIALQCLAPEVVETGITIK